MKSQVKWAKQSNDTESQWKFQVLVGTLRFFPQSVNLIFDSICHDSISEICLFWISSKTGSVVLSCYIEYFHVACPLMMLFCLVECQLRIDNESQKKFQVFVGTLYFAQSAHWHLVVNRISHDSISGFCVFWISSRTGTARLSCSIEYFHVACSLMVLFVLWFASSDEQQ